MREVLLSDVTMKQTVSSPSLSLTFKEKLEIAKLLDKLGVSVIELTGIDSVKIDSLRIKSIALAVRGSILAVPVKLERENVALVQNALSQAKRARLQVPAAVSPVQMEYIYHKKPAAMLEAVVDTIAACREVCEDVEFIADDATRADSAFLFRIVSEAIAAGAKTVTICDTAGKMLPDELTDFLEVLYANVPELANVRLGISCSNELAMADACAVAAVRRGASEVKAAAYRINSISLPNIAKLLADKGAENELYCPVPTTEMKRITDRIGWMCKTTRSENSPFDNGVAVPAEDTILSVHDDREAVLRAVEKLGYDLSEEDAGKVWEAFSHIAARKELVGSRELDAIVASAAMQVPPTYKLDTYVVNASSNISAMAHLKLKKAAKVLEGVSLGDGPIDAAFLAIEQIVGHHYELDDFQVQAVTEGREAMGQSVVKLRHSGKIYSGRGISTDIVGASIMAYISALNKIVYEEEEA